VASELNRHRATRPLKARATPLHALAFSRLWPMTRQLPGTSSGAQERCYDVTS
jgi:hypothetical protein